MKLSSIVAVVRAMNDSSVPFIVVGGLAVVAHPLVDVFVTEPFDFDEEFKALSLRDKLLVIEQMEEVSAVLSAARHARSNAVRSPDANKTR